MTFAGPIPTAAPRQHPGGSHLQGLMELIERDACAIRWYIRAVLPGIDLASFHHPISNASPIRSRSATATCMCSISPTTSASLPSWRYRANVMTAGEFISGSGADLSPRTAISRALSELTQAIAFEFSTDPVKQIAFFDDHAHWLDSQHFGDHLYPSRGATSSLASAISSTAPRPISAATCAACVDMLAGKGMETIVLDQTRPEIGFPVARVAVPELRHFWSRFAPGRLYDVPPGLGWRAAPLDEASLNPVSSLSDRVASKEEIVSDRFASTDIRGYANSTCARIQNSTLDNDRRNPSKGCKDGTPLLAWNLPQCPQVADKRKKQRHGSRR